MKIIKLLIISSVLLLNLQASEINSENLKMEDYGTFLVKQLHLSKEESKQSAKELFKKGLELYNSKGTVKYVKDDTGNKYAYTSQTAKKKSMSYLIAAGLLGEPRASMIAMNYLVNSNMDHGEYRYILAKSLSDDGYLYGTYILGLGYVHGNGIARDRDAALYYLGIVKDYCDQKTNDTYLSIASDRMGVNDTDKIIKIGKRRCQLAILFYKNTKNTTFTTKTPKAKELKASKEFREAIKQQLINKQDSAINEYLKNNQR